VICAGILLVFFQVYPPANIDPEFAGLKFQISPITITSSVITGVPILSIIIYAVFLIQTMMTFKIEMHYMGCLLPRQCYFFYSYLNFMDPHDIIFI
jgi:hypothetical protein